MDYELALEVVNKLEPIKSNKLQNSDKARMLARLVCDHDVMDMKYISDLTESLMSSSQENESKEQPITELSPDKLLDSDFLSNLIYQWIQGIRQRFFRRRSAPFGSFDDAIKWMQSYNVHEIYQLDGMSQAESLDYIHKHYRTECNLNLSYRSDTDEDIDIFPYARSKVEKIIRAAIQIEDETGFTRGSVVMYILADIKPFLPPYQLAVPTMWPIFPRGNEWIEYERKQVWITLFTELNFSELRAIYKYIRNQLGTRRLKQHTGKHLTLYRMVQEKGGPPKRKGTVAFWASMQKEWNSMYPNDKYETWKGVKLTYDRLLARLNATHNIRKANVG